MFKPAEKSELNQISLTGMRAIILVGLLIEAPRTLDEIRKAFISLNIMEPEHSNDIIRIDLNTLRAMGCDITRANVKTGFKYRLIKHPFTLNITLEELGVLKKAYKKVKDRGNIELLIQYDKLFKKISGFVDNNEIREVLYGLSVLKSYDIDLIQDLIEDCKLNRALKLVYKTPSSKENSEKEISAQKLVFENDKIYLYGFDFMKNKSVVLNLQRIKSILARLSGNSNIQIDTTNVKFLLKNFGVADIQENEKIIETNDNGYLIEGNYYNDFLAMQRILSFGADCTVLEPQDFREKVIQKLKSMRNIYND